MATLLAGDIGGTKTVLGLFECEEERFQTLHERVFPSSKYACLEAILTEYLAGLPSQPTLAAACFGVAGAIVDGRCKTTNLPWELDEVSLAEEVRVRRCKLLNDLEAAAFGMLFLADSEKVVIQTGKQLVRHANLAVIAAGTGLGEAMLYWDGDHYDPIASEGGHTDFAPQSDLEIELLRYLQRKFGGHVSYERIVSGPGIFNVYQFLRDTGLEAEPANLAEELAGGDPSATIARHASSVAICRRTMEVFLRIYGAEAGNLALKCMATGGVFVAGGVAAKNFEWMTHSAFTEGFSDKGRFRALCEAIPIIVSTNERAPLHGAAHYAERLV